MTKEANEQTNKRLIEKNERNKKKPNYKLHRFLRMSYKQTFNDISIQLLYFLFGYNTNLNSFHL